MATTPLPRRRLVVAGLAAVLTSAGCSAERRASAPAPPSTAPVEQPPEHNDEQLDSAAPPAAALSPAERSQLGLPPAGTAVEAGLPPLSDEQWADPVAVAVRFALVHSNYRTVEDQTTVQARSAVYLTRRLNQDVAGGGGRQRLGELRAEDAVFRGDVVGVAVVERFDNRAVVDLAVRRSFTTRAVQSRPARVAFWRLTLVRDPVGGRWLIVALTMS
jgi:hypothetical protein